MRKKLHYDWHWVWPTGNGDIGNQGVHEMDLCRWFVGNNTLPEQRHEHRRALRLRRRRDHPQHPDHLLRLQARPLHLRSPRPARREAPDANQWPPWTPSARSIRVGIWIQCENGYFAAGEGGGWAYDKDGKKIKQFKQQLGAGRAPGELHQGRAEPRPEGQPLQRRGRPLLRRLLPPRQHQLPLGQGQAPPATSPTPSSPTPRPSESFDRMKEHLAKNDVDLKKSKIILGPQPDDRPRRRAIHRRIRRNRQQAPQEREYRKPSKSPNRSTAIPLRNPRGRALQNAGRILCVGITDLLNRR